MNKRSLISKMSLHMMFCFLFHFVLSDGTCTRSGDTMTCNLKTLGKWAWEKRTELKISDFPALNQEILATKHLIITCGKELKHMDEECFKGFINMEKLQFDGGQWIFFSNRACKGLTKLQNILSTEWLYSIGVSSFQGCTSLQGFEHTENVKTLSESSFEGCSSLIMPYLPKVSSIPKRVFYGCSSFVSFSGSYGEAGEQAFANCSGLKEFTLRTNYDVPASLCENCTALESFRMEDTTTIIYDAPSLGNRVMAVCR